MDLVLKGRGVRVTDQIRRTVSLKLAKLERFESHALRVEVEVIAEQNPRQDGLKRIEAADYDVFSRVIRIPRPRRALIALGTWARVLTGA